MEVEHISCEEFKIGKEISSNKKLPTQLRICVDSIIKNEGFLTHKVNTKEVSTKGGNYLAKLFEIDIQGKTKNGAKEVNLFVKNIVPLNDEFSSFLSIGEAYIVECFAYKELSKIFTKLQDEANVPAEDRYKILKSYDESNEDMIILENATRKEFSTCNRMEVPPLRFVELSIEQLAKFHALAFALEKKMPDYFEKKLKHFKFPLKFNEDLRRFYAKAQKSSIKQLKSASKKKVENVAPTLIDEYEKYIKDTLTIRTFCHGDFRMNNILMKKVEGEVTEVIPVDYQIMYYGCPVNDILYFIYGCTDGKLRKKHLQNLLDLYYDTLTRYLKYFNVDVNDVYPRDVYESALKARALFGLIVALTFYPFIFAPEDEVPDIGDTINSVEVNLSDDVVERIEEIIEDLDEMGVFE